MVVVHSRLSECPGTVARQALVLVMTLCVYNFLDASLLNIEDMLYKKSGVQQDRNTIHWCVANARGHLYLGAPLL